MEVWDYVSIISIEPLFRVLSEAVRPRTMEVITLRLRVACNMHHGVVVIILNFLIEHKFSA